MRTLLISLLVFGGACGASTGGEGQRCNSGGTLGGFSCNAGLVCLNFGGLCVAMHSQQQGGPCDDGSNAACAVGLACTSDGSGWQCGNPLGRGEECGVGTECATGLDCLKECDNRAECLVPDASDPCGSPQDAGADAAADAARL